MEEEGTREEQTDDEIAQERQEGVGDGSNSKKWIANYAAEQETWTRS